MHAATEAADTPLETFDRIHDREDAGGVLVVCDVRMERADAFELTAGITVADVNPAYPDEDPVVLALYENHLDRLKPDWRGDSRREFRDWIRYKHEGRPPQIQALPASRCRRYTAGNYTKRSGGVVCENCDQQTETVADWLEHVARECVVTHG